MSVYLLAVMIYVGIGALGAGALMGRDPAQVSPERARLAFWFFFAWPVVMPAVLSFLSSGAKGPLLAAAERPAPARPGKRVTPHTTQPQQTLLAAHPTADRRGLRYLPKAERIATERAKARRTGV